VWRQLSYQVEKKTTTKQQNNTNKNKKSKNKNKTNWQQKYKSIQKTNKFNFKFFYSVFSLSSLSLFFCSGRFVNSAGKVREELAWCGAANLFSPSSYFGCLVNQDEFETSSQLLTKVGIFHPSISLSFFSLSLSLSLSLSVSLFLSCACLSLLFLPFSS